jgi:hypothetical protein
VIADRQSPIADRRRCHGDEWAQSVKCDALCATRGVEKRERTRLVQRAALTR